MSWNNNSKLSIKELRILCGIKNNSATTSIPTPAPKRPRMLSPQEAAVVEANTDGDVVMHLPAPKGPRILSPQEEADIRTNVVETRARLKRIVKYLSKRPIILLSLQELYAIKANTVAANALADAVMPFSEPKGPRILSRQEAKARRTRSLRKRKLSPQEVASNGAKMKPKNTAPTLKTSALLRRQMKDAKAAGALSKQNTAKGKVDTAMQPQQLSPTRKTSILDSLSF